MIHLAAWTHVGLVRGRNEDVIAVPGALLVGSPPAPLVTAWTPSSRLQTIAVVDGMGGHAGGEEASRIVGAHLTGVNDDVTTALAAVNRELYDEMDRTPSLRAMGATVAGVQVTDASVEAFNVGDSRVYTHVDGYTTLVSIDDRSESGSGELTQSLGGTTARTTIELHRRPIDASDPLRLLICSDGLSEYVSFSSVQDTLDVPDVGDAAARLVRLALDAGGPDNVSVVVVDWPGVDRLRR